MATINLDKALQFLKEQDAKTKAEAIRMSADPSLRGLPSTGAHIDPRTGTARVGTVAPAPAGADPFVKTKHGFFARNYGPPAGTQGQGGVSMAAQYPSVATPGLSPIKTPGLLPIPRVTGGPGIQLWDRGVRDTAGTQGRGGVSMQAPYRVPSPRPTFTPGDLSRWGGQRGQIENLVSPGMMSKDPTWAGIPRAVRQMQQLPGRNPPRPPWDAGQTRLPNQRVPSKAQVTITQEQGKPEKKVTKYDIGQDDTVGVSDQGRASSEYQISGMLRRAMANSARNNLYQDKSRSAGVSMDAPYDIPPPMPPGVKVTALPGSSETHPVNLQPWPVRKAYWGDDRDLQLMSLDQEEGLYRAPIRKSAREKLNDLLRQIEASREGTTMAPFDLGQRLGLRSY